jgi:hypothetical protein
MSDFSNRYPEYASVEEHIRRAHLERSVAIAHMIAVAADKAIRGVERLVASLGDSLQAEHERRLIEADTFLRRSLPHR